MVSMPNTARTCPSSAAPLFLTDGGIETTLIFHDGLELPHFAAFHLLRDAEGRERAARATTSATSRSPRPTALGFVLESPTWRASADWGAKLGYSADDLAAVNRQRDRSCMHDAARRARDARHRRWS